MLNRIKMTPTSAEISFGCAILIIGNSDQPAGTTVLGLQCETTYNITLSASNAGGVDEASTQVDTGTCGVQEIIFENGFEALRPP